MIWTTTGNLTNIRKNAKFEFGTAMLPAGKRRGSPTGGGNFYVFKSGSAEQQAAAFKFAKWMTEPKRAAEWAIRSEEHTSELQSLMRISYTVFCLKKKTKARKDT